MDTALKEDMSAPTAEKPNPGSAEATRLGCTCPVVDNGYGKGYQCVAGMFVWDVDCPVHFPPAAKTLEQA